MEQTPRHCVALGAFRIAARCSNVPATTVVFKILLGHVNGGARPTSAVEQPLAEHFNGCASHIQGGRFILDWLFTVSGISYVTRRVRAIPRSDLPASKPSQQLRICSLQ